MTTLTSLIASVRSKLRDFRVAQGGNIAIVFGLSAIPVVGVMGAAIDYSRANSAKAAMQAAIDATTLMLSKEVTSLTQSQLQEKAFKYFLANFNRPDAKNVVVTPTYVSSGGSQLTITATASVPTVIAGIIGKDYIPIGTTSTTKWGTTRLRVALALDTTGSMQSDGKMAALKTATKDLLNQLKGAATNNEDVYVSIIPFSKDVNVGPGNYKATWIDWTEWDANNGSCKNYGWGSAPQNRSDCLAKNGTWTSANRNTWNGCVTDRGTSGGPSNDYDRKVTAPVAGVTASLFPAEQYAYCSPPAMGLSYNWTAMTSLVDGLYPSGSTNQPIGLVWGWQSLVGGGPFTVPAKDSKYIYKEVIVLMSDGLNTQDRWYGNGYNTSTSVDRRMYDTNGAGTCKNVKDSGVIIYALHVNTNGDPQSTLLKNCASGPDKFWMVTTASGMISVFNQIGTELSQLHLAN